MWVLYGLDAPSSFATSSLTVQSHWLLSPPAIFYLRAFACLCDLASCLAHSSQLSFWLQTHPLDLTSWNFWNTPHFLDIVIVCIYLFLTIWLLSISHRRRKLHAYVCCHSYPGPLLASGTQLALFLQLNLWMSGWMEAVVITSCSPVNKWISLP